VLHEGHTWTVEVPFKFHACGSWLNINVDNSLCHKLL
jgi:hypothetical protein